MADPTASVSDDEPARAPNPFRLPTPDFELPKGTHPAVAEALVTSYRNSRDANAALYDALCDDNDPVSKLGRIMDQRFTDISNKLAGIDQKVTGIDDKVTGMGQKVTGIHHKLTDIDQQVTGIDTKLTGIDYKLTGIDHKLEEIKSMLRKRPASRSPDRNDNRKTATLEPSPSKVLPARASPSLSRAPSRSSLSASLSVTNGPCYYYNLGVCSPNICQGRRHICSRCSGGHGAFNCPK